MEANTLELSNLTSILNEYGDKVKQTYKSELTTTGHDASTALNQSVQFRVDFKDSGAMKSFQVTLSMEDYWKYLEYGTNGTQVINNPEHRKREKFPPMNKIRDWIQVKPVIPYPDKNGRLPTLNQLTYLISRKIYIEGTPRTELLKKSVEQVNSEYLPKIREAFRKDFSDHVSLLVRQLI